MTDYTYYRDREDPDICWRYDSPGGQNGMVRSREIGWLPAAMSEEDQRWDGIPVTVEDVVYWVSTGRWAR